MSKIQTLTLKVNPKNGTVVIPQKIRKAFNIQNSLVLIIREGKLEILPNKYTLDQVLNDLPSLKSDKNFSEKDFKETIESEVIKNYKKCL